MQSIGYYLREAREAVDYVQSKMTTGADNRPDDVVTSFFTAHSCVSGMRASYQTEFWHNSPWAERIKVAALWAEQTGCGNCGEQSAMAYEYLRLRGVLPLEFMGLMPPKNHNFVVVGRDPASDVASPNTWGRSAVVCDPWKRKAYVAALLYLYWPGGVPYLVSGIELPPPPPLTKTAKLGR